MSMAASDTPNPSKHNVSQDHHECSPDERADLFVDDNITRALSRRLVRKLDLTLMPTVWLLYMLKNLDKGNISSV